MSLYGLARPLLFSLDAENAHQIALRTAGLAGLFSPPVPSAPVRVMGIDFPNPIGAAAGLDKHAEHVGALSSLGFGFLELGGVTPLPQPGNARPRLFRIEEARAIINRFGLNSVGVEVFAENLRRARTRAVIGVNVGKNKDTPNERAADDYASCLEVLYPHVHYLAINVSSPNTVGLRDLQSAQTLAALLRRVRERRDALRERHGRNVALTLKISPDIDDAAMAGIADVARRERVGGIMSGADAREKFDAGASLVQIYSGLVFRGPELIAECVSAYRAK